MSLEPKSVTSERPAWYVRVWRFYAEGFRGMTVGRTLWALILIKLAIMFLVLKVFFFPDLLQRDYDTDEERSQAVRRSMIERSGMPEADRQP